MSESYNLGKIGEELAIAHLQQQGYHILETRWHLRHLEIDIIATKGQELVFVEVKTRRTDYYGDPFNAVDSKKIRHLANAADAYIKMHQTLLEPRFDIISIVVPLFGKPQIEHIKDAFSPPMR